MPKLRNPRAVRFVFLIFRFRDSVGPLDTSVWANSRVTRPPCVQCPSETDDFGNWAVAGGGNDRCRSAGVAEVVAAHQVLGDDPGGGDLPARVAGDESGPQPTPGPLGEPVGAAAQDAADPVERVTTMTPMPVDVLLHAAADLFDRGQPELRDMERVGTRSARGSC